MFIEILHDEMLVLTFQSFLTNIDYVIDGEYKHCIKYWNCNERPRLANRCIARSLRSFGTDVAGESFTYDFIAYEWQARQV